MNSVNKVTMHLFEMNENLYAYDYFKNVLIKIDANAYGSLKTIESQMEVSGEAEQECQNQALQFYKKVGLFVRTDEELKEDTAPELKKTAYISYPTEHRCNLRCKYCFANHGTNYKGEQRSLSKERVCDILDFVCSDYFKEYSEIRIDFVSGGEPLLNSQVLVDTVDYFEEMYAKTKKRAEIFLCTNGTINDASLWKYIDIKKINLGMSIDGNEEMHNTTRVYSDGSGSYQDVKKTVSDIIDSSEYSPHTKAIRALSVITGKTKSLIDIIQHNKKLGFSSVQMKVARLPKEHEFSVSEENIDDLIQLYWDLNDYFIEKSFQHDYSDLCMILNENDYYGKLLYRVLSGGRTKRCHAGDDKFSFDAMGNIYPCDSFIGMEEFCLGNIYNGVDENARKRFVDGTVMNRKKCSTCWARFLCAGDCFHNSFLANGDIYEPDEIICRLNKALSELVLHLYYVIRSNGDISQLEKIVRVRRRMNP